MDLIQECMLFTWLKKYGLKREKRIDKKQLFEKVWFYIWAVRCLGSHSLQNKWKKVTLSYLCPQSIKKNHQYVIKWLHVYSFPCLSILKKFTKDCHYFTGRDFYPHCNKTGVLWYETYRKRVRATSSWQDRWGKQRTAMMHLNSQEARSRPRDRSQGTEVPVKAFIH